MLNQLIQEISTGLIQKVAVWGFQRWVNPLEEKWQNHCGYKPEWTATRLMSHPNFNNESPTVAITAACITFCCLLETVPFVVHATCSVSVFADAFFFLAADVPSDLWRFPQNFNLCYVSLRVVATVKTLLHNTFAKLTIFSCVPDFTVTSKPMVCAVIIFFFFVMCSAVEPWNKNLTI